jgi:SAM-dependent methyltransferase
MSQTSVKPYHWLAKYYDRVFTVHHPWAEAARAKVLGPILPQVKSACDLACGTGSTALKFARAGVRMFGVDLSSDMCRITRARAQKARLPVYVLRADMRTFRLPEQVDLVLCEFDAINHVPRKLDFGRVVRAVARALRPGGYFYFDVNNRLGFKSYWKGSMWIEKPGLVLVMNSGNDARHDRAWSDCEWFVREGRFWRRHRERVEEVCWRRTEIERTLRGSGFDRVRAWDAAPFFKTAAFITPGCRTHYLARKAPDGASPRPKRL